MVTQAFINTIYLSNVGSVAFIFLCGWIVFTAHPEVALGIYFAMGGWTRTLQVGPIAHTWVLLVTIVFGTVMLLMRRSKQVGSIHLPQRDRWILTWLIFWWGWITLLFVTFRSDFMPGLFNNLVENTLLYVLIPLPFIMLLPHQITRIRNFALGFLLTAVLGGWFALQVIHIPLSYLLKDPTLTSFGVVQLGVINYHWFAYPFAISVLFGFGLIKEFKNIFARVLLFGFILVCVYFLILAGSRQSILGCVAGILFFSAWIVSRHKVSSAWVIPLVTGVFAFMYWLILQAPDLLRLGLGSQAGVIDVNATRIIDFIQSRSVITWQEGIKTFLSSSIWGVGFSQHYVSHNLFIGTGADQGIVGLIFLVGFLIFWARQAILAWREVELNIENTWRMILVSVMIFELVQSQFSGSPIAEWAMWWSTTFLWIMNQAAQEHKPVNNANPAHPGRNMLGVTGLRKTPEIKGMEIVTPKTQPGTLSDK